VKVLVVVEDDPDMRLLVRLTLGDDERLELTGEAATAAQAVAAARDSAPDLVVLDHFIDGPVMGLQAAPLIRAAAPDCRILLFSTHDLAAEVALEPAIDAFLQKRNMDRLLETARGLLGLADA
jgi:two-component system nitrate/nitrite response regulator NarL